MHEVLCSISNTSIKVKIFFKNPDYLLPSTKTTTKKYKSDHINAYFLQPYVAHHKLCLHLHLLTISILLILLQQHWSDCYTQIFQACFCFRTFALAVLSAQNLLLKLLVWIIFSLFSGRQGFPDPSTQIVNTFILSLYPALSCILALTTT